jgi:hypothetical protein
MWILTSEYLVQNKRLFAQCICSADQYIYIYIKFKIYCISEYKSDLEDKLQKYNKINGAIRRHFGKQMTKETKLRIHNMTALKFGSKVWALKKRDE